MEAVHGSMLLIYAVIAIAVLILMIARYKVYPFLVLIIVSLLLGLAVGMPMAAGLSVVQGLIPPHPAALLAVQAYGADIGKTIAYGLIVGIPTAIVAGPLFALLIHRYVKLPENNPLAAQFVESHVEGAAKRELPGFPITLFTILLPVILMLVGSWADLMFAPKSLPNNLLRFAGTSDVALLIAVLVSFWTFGADRGFKRDPIQ